jgi:hypothetical protein
MVAEYGWGRAEGRRVFGEFLRSSPAPRAEGDVLVLSLRDVEGIDISFAAETVVALAALCRGRCGYRVSDIGSQDIADNIDSAAQRARIPILCDVMGHVKMLGLEPSPGTVAVLEFLLDEGEVRTSDVAQRLQITPSNASNKLKQLWRDGFLVRAEQAAASGGVEFTYRLPG